MTIEEVQLQDAPVIVSYLEETHFDDLFEMTVEEVNDIVNPYTGASLLSQRQEELPINPWTGSEMESVLASATVEPVAIEEEETEVVEITKQFDQAAAYARFKKYYSQLEAANKVLAQHALICTGADGHKKVTAAFTEEDFDLVSMQTFEAVLQTELGQKIASELELSTEEEQQLIEFTAQASDEILGTETLKLLQELTTYEDFSWSDGQASRLIIEQANAQHIHSTACGHGGGFTMESSSYNVPSGVYGPVFDTDNHEHHNKLVTCKECNHKMIAHVHGSEGPTCPRCRKGKMKVATKR